MIATVHTELDFNSILVGDSVWAVAVPTGRRQVLWGIYTNGHNFKQALWNFTD